MSEERRTDLIGQAAIRLGLSGDDLRDQFANVGAWTWSRRERLESHARQHRDDFVEAFGRVYAADEVDRLARSVIATPDQMLLLPFEAGAQFVAVRLYPNDSAMIAILREGFLRTLYRATRYAVWRAHHSEAIDVTDIYYER